MFESNSENNLEKGKNMRFSGEVLVAEDNPSNQMLIKLLLHKYGFEPTIADDGQIAVDVYQSKDFKMVFMDMMMPNMNGYEATRALRHMGVEVPIVAVTANAMRGDREKCLDAGCDDYISKPITNEKLEEVLCKYLEQHNSDNLGKDKSSMKPASNNDLIISDLADDSDLVVVAEMFVERLEEVLVKMKESFENNDMKTLKDLAHEIKGAGGSAGFNILTEKCAAMEPLILDNKVEDVKVALAEFFSICKKVRATQPV
jgi:two-component system, sensor histidine kinase